MAPFPATAAASDHATSTVGSSTAIETALTTLLPIRDLAKNWDIDIASCLDEYLQDLELSLSQDTRDRLLVAAAATACGDGGGSRSINFAQAAMVLHNSSGIYSRKVDYLHSYAYKVQEEFMLHNTALFEVGGGATKGGKNKKGQLVLNKKDAQVEALLSFDPQQEFLMLNDVVPVDGTLDCSKIAIVPWNDDGNEATASLLDATTTTTLTPYSSRRRRRNSRLSLGMSANRRSSWGGSGIGDNSSNKSSSMLLDNMAAQQQRAALLGSLGEAASSGSLNLVRRACEIGPNGILQIPGGSSFQSHPATNRDPTAVRLEENAAAAQDMDTNEDTTSFGDDNGNGSFSNDNDDEGVGFVLADPDSSGGTDPAAVGTRRVTFAADTTITTTTSGAKSHNPGVPTIPVFRDPWTLLDRDTPEDSKKKPRPLRIGNTLVLPIGLDQPPSTSTGSGGLGARIRQPPRRDARDPQSMHRRVSSHHASFQIAETFQASLLGKRHQMSEENQTSSSWSFSGGLAFGNEFAYIAKATAKRKAEERREQRLQQQQQQQNNPASVDYPTTNSAARHDTNDDNDYAQVDFGGDDDDDNNEFGEGGNDWDGEQNTVLPMASSNTGIASVDDIYRTNQSTNGTADTQTETRTFEELCRAHIQAFARGAEKYAAETKLSARVNQWQEKLMPLLDEEGERPIFDIRAYGLTVVQSMEQQISRRQLSRKGIEENKEVGHCKPHVSRTVAFGDITRECPSFDVCRLFLAALSLNNSGNISFAPDSTMNSLKMDLLNSDVEGPISSLQGILESDSEMAF